jgi:hypothetical protein
LLLLVCKALFSFGTAVSCGEGRGVFLEVSVIDVSWQDFGLDVDVGAGVMLGRGVGWCPQGRIRVAKRVATLVAIVKRKIVVHGIPFILCLLV